MESYVKLYRNKVRGWIFLNGNVSREADLVNMFKSRILNPEHTNPYINKTKKVLLVTAAFNRGEEHDDRHLIYMFEKIGIDPMWEGRFPTNIQNLSIWSMFEIFKHKEPWLYRRYTEKQDQIKAVKYDYYKKNHKYVNTIDRLTEELESTYDKLGLYEFYYYERLENSYEMFLVNLDENLRREKVKQLDRLSHSKKDLLKCKELKENLDHLIYKDAEIFNLIESIEKFFLEKSGVENSLLYKEQRDELAHRILTSATIFLFGGRVYVIVNRLRFYQLAEVFKKALDNGTNLYGISAGTLAMTDKFGLSFEKKVPGGYLRAADHGMGLVKNLWVYPHADDYNYIRETQRDELSFFALRHRQGTVIGLNEKSVLLCEEYFDEGDNTRYKRYVSVGEDPVLVFGEKGIRVELNYMDQILLNGSKFYKGYPCVATASEIEQLEKEAISKKI